MQARNMVSRVKNEIMVQHQLKHPSVLELYNFFEDENYVYLVLELADNGALNKFLKTKQTKLREADGKGVCQCVMWLHVRGVVCLCCLVLMHVLICMYCMYVCMYGPGGEVVWVLGSSWVMGSTRR